MGSRRRSASQRPGGLLAPSEAPGCQLPPSGLSLTASTSSTLSLTGWLVPLPRTPEVQWQD